MRARRSLWMMNGEWLNPMYVGIGLLGQLKEWLVIYEYLFRVYFVFLDVFLQANLVPVYHWKQQFWFPIKIFPGWHYKCKYNSWLTRILKQQGHIWMNIKNLYHWENSKAISIVVIIGNLLIMQQFDQSERSAISCNLCGSKSNTLRSPLSAGYKSEFLLLQEPSLWILKASLWPDPPPPTVHLISSHYSIASNFRPTSSPRHQRFFFKWTHDNWSNGKNG